MIGSFLFWIRHQSSVSRVRRPVTHNKVHIRYVESALLTRARASASWTVSNSNSPSPPPLGRAGKISADLFLETLFDVAPILSVSAFVQPVARGGGRLTHVHLFSSPSTAATCLLARSANGRTEWRDSEDRTLRDIQESGTE